MKFTNRALALVCLSAASTAFCGDAAAQQQAAAPGPQHAAVANATPTAPARSTARIRLFGQNGFGVRFYENSACIGGKAKETTVSGGVGDAFSSLFGSVKNVSIGIKDTPNTLNISKRNGIASKAYFREYEVAAAQPLTVQMSFQSNPGGSYAYCNAVGGSFTPEAGKDYEASLDVEAGSCVAVIREIADAADGSVQLQKVNVAPTKECD